MDYTYQIIDFIERNPDYVKQINKAKFKYKRDSTKLRILINYFVMDIVSQYPEFQYIPRNEIDIDYISANFMKEDL